MLAAFGFSESEGKMRLSAIGSSVRRKNLLRMDDVRENAFPDAYSMLQNGVIRDQGKKSPVD
jgi:hypothetical protein